MPVRISDYYVLNPVYEPSRIEYREFAFVNNGRFFRHRAFWNIRDLRTFLVSFAPEEVFFSGAYYQHPGIVPIDEKKKYRVGADLIFDIDCEVLPSQTIEEAYFYALKQQGLILKGGESSWIASLRIRIHYILSRLILLSQGTLPDLSGCRPACMLGRGILESANHLRSRR